MVCKKNSSTSSLTLILNISTKILKLFYKTRSQTRPSSLPAFLFCSFDVAAYHTLFPPCSLMVLLCASSLSSFPSPPCSTGKSLFILEVSDFFGVFHADLGVCFCVLPSRLCPFLEHVFCCTEVVSLLS